MFASKRPYESAAQAPFCGRFAKELRGGPDADLKVEASTGRLAGFPRAAILEFQLNRPRRERLELEVPDTRLAGGAARAFDGRCMFVQDLLQLLCGFDRDGPLEAGGRIFRKADLQCVPYTEFHLTPVKSLVNLHHFAWPRAR
jgi:hypothetical protein